MSRNVQILILLFPYLFFSILTSELKFSNTDIVNNNITNISQYL